MLTLKNVKYYELLTQQNIQQKRKTLSSETLSFVNHEAHYIIITNNGENTYKVT